MPETNENLKDVKCEKCGRVIGQRNGCLFIQFKMKFYFDKSGKISCPYLGCEFEQVFRVNRDASFSRLELKAA